MDKRDLGAELGDEALHLRIAEIESEDERVANSVSERKDKASEPDEFNPGAVIVNEPKKPSEAWQKWLRSWKFWAAASGVLLVTLSLVFLFVTPFSSALLNTIGQKSYITISAYEKTPAASSPATSIKKFTVLIDGDKSYNSGDSNTVSIDGLSYGQHSVKVSKDGYRDVETTLYVELNNHFALFSAPTDTNKTSVNLEAIGISVSFMIKDQISQTPITEANFVLNDKTARPNQEGLVTLVVPPSDTPKVDIKATFGGAYIDKTISIDMGSKTEAVYTFVPLGKHYFISKRSGTYDVYSTNVDGSDQKLVIAGTDQETASLVFAVNPSGKHALMASTRDGTRDQNGGLLQKLYLVDLITRRLIPIDKGLYFKFYDWSDDSLIYSYSYKEPKSTQSSVRLRSVNSVDQNVYDLGTSTGYFSSVVASNGTVLKVQGEAYGQPSYTSSPILKSVNIDGGNSKNLATKVTDFRRLDFDRFAYMSKDKKWTELNTNSSAAKSIAAPTEDGKVYLSGSSPQTNSQLIIDNIDGKNVLQLRPSADGKIRTLATAAGLRGPIRWINDTTLVYRIVSSSETADYVVSTLGGKASKIVDVTATATAGQETPRGFYYY